MSVFVTCTDCGKTGDPTDPTSGFEDVSYYDGRLRREAARFMCSVCYREYMDQAILDANAPDDDD